VYCVKCGGELAGGASFCKFCGSPQAGSGAASESAAVPPGSAAPAGAVESRAASGSILTSSDYIIMGALIAIALLLILIFAAT
jgi:hypothetical protein